MIISGKNEVAEISPIVTTFISVTGRKEGKKTT
jgi:hypothetical protein